MIAFDDFDAWGNAVSGAHLRLACDAVERRSWTLGVLDLDGIVLQVATEGGGNLCYGGNTHNGTLLFVPLTHAGKHVANGQPLDDDTLFAIPRGADFSITVRRRAHSWCSIALPDSCEIPGLSGSARIACRTGSLWSLRRMVLDVTQSLLDRPAGTPAHRAAGTDIAAAALSCLARSSPPRTTAGRPRLDREIIVRRAMELIESSTTMPATADLARRIGVNDRTLLRTFRETFGVPPKKYLMLRELHIVRRLLVAQQAPDATVATALSGRGIWEFGRFAGRYRDHFGELPSQTLKRVHG